MKSWDWSKFLSFFTFEWRKKLAALLIALLIFYYVNSLSYVEQTMSLLIEYRGLPDRLVIVDRSDTQVTLNVKGRAEKVRELDRKNSVLAVVNLENASPGISNYPIKLEINTPKPDMTLNLSRDAVTLTIDRLAEASVPVKPSYVGTLKPGYFIEDVALDRRQVIISGPSESVLRATNGVETVPIDIDGATNDLDQTIDLRMPPSIELLTRENIHIHIRVVQKPTGEWRTNQ